MNFEKKFVSFFIFFEKKWKNKRFFCKNKKIFKIFRENKDLDFAD